MQNCYSGPVSTEQSARLTTKHIHTLKFLQEVVAENKELKEKLNDVQTKDCKCQDVDKLAEENRQKIHRIQEKYLKHADDINAMLVEKHKAEMMKKVEEHLETEKHWFLEKEQFMAEIEELKKKVVDQNTHLEDGAEQQGRAKIFELKVAALEQEISRLKGNLANLQDNSKGQLEQVQKMEFIEDQNRHLKDELAAANQRITELEFKIRKLEQDMCEKDQNDYTDILRALKNKVAKMHKEKCAYEEREKEYLSNMDGLQQENITLRRALDDSERMRQDMKLQLEYLLQQLDMLKRQLSPDKDRQTFKDFIQVKREVASLRDENEALKIKIKQLSGKESGFPSLKAAEKKPSYNHDRPRTGHHDQSHTNVLGKKDLLQLKKVSYK